MAGLHLVLSPQCLRNTLAVVFVAFVFTFALKLHRARRKFTRLSKDGLVGRTIESTVRYTC